MGRGRRQRSQSTGTQPAQGWKPGDHPTMSVTDEEVLLQFIIITDKEIITGERRASRRPGDLILPLDYALANEGKDLVHDTISAAKAEGRI